MKHVADESRNLTPTGFNMNETPTRVCNVCYERFPLTAEHWHKQPRNTNGLSETCKACAIVRAREHYAANSQQYRENSKAYRKLHPEIRLREYAKNREHIAAYQRDYYEKNTAKVKACARAYAEANREKIHERTRNTYWAGPRGITR